LPKKKTSISIDEEVYKLVKEKSVNLSDLCNKLLKRHFLTSENNPAIKARIELLDKEIKEIEAEKQRKQTEKQTLKEKLERKQDEKQKYDERLEKMAKKRARGENIGTLVNYAAKDFNKDKEEVIEDVKQKRGS